MLGNRKEKRHLKYEISHSCLEVQLLEQDARNLKEEAGAFAYSLWGAEKFSAEALDEYFVNVKERENAIEKKNEYITALKAQLDVLNGKKRDGEPEAKEVKEEGGVQEERVLKEILPITCPACGAHYKLPANFCRRCGTLLLSSPAEG